MTDDKGGSAPMLCSAHVRVSGKTMAPFVDAAFMLSMSESEVRIQFEDRDTAEEIFGWLESLPFTFKMAIESRQKWEESVADIKRLGGLPIVEKLRDRKDAMKIVPMFAIEIMRDAAKAIEERDAIILNLRNGVFC
jgi:hypothetical protein